MRSVSKTSYTSCLSTLISGCPVVSPASLLCISVAEVLSLKLYSCLPQRIPLSTRTRYETGPRQYHWPYPVGDPRRLRAHTAFKFSEALRVCSDFPSVFCCLSCTLSPTLGDNRSRCVCSSHFIKRLQGDTSVVE